MSRLASAISLLSVSCLILYGGLITEVHTFECRNGIENSVAYIYWEKTCTNSRPACFQSVKCTKIGDTPYQDFEWRCIDAGECTNGTGQRTAYYKNIKGICCFTSHCNAYKAACTDSASISSATWIPLVSALAFAYLFLKP